jgi:pre-mRNA-processing factor 19
MYCSISGVAPREPVLSKTGFIFERRLIEEHLQQTGQCPVTNQPLTENDLTDIKGESACVVARDWCDVKIHRQ